MEAQRLMLVTWSSDQRAKSSMQQPKTQKLPRPYDDTGLTLLDGRGNTVALP